jgi:hypothetical protein
MSDGVSNGYLLAGYVPLLSQGLALPCFRSSTTANVWYCAICSIDGDRNGTVVEFDPLEALHVVELQEVECTVANEDPWHDVLLWKGATYVGTPKAIIARLGERTIELVAEAPLTILDLAMASDGLDRAALVQNAYTYVEAQWGQERADRWEARSFVRPHVMVEIRRLLAAVGVTGAADIVREIEVVRTGQSLVVQMPAALCDLLDDNDISGAFAERIALFSQQAGVGLAAVAKSGRTKVRDGDAVIDAAFGDVGQHFDRSDLQARLLPSLKSSGGVTRVGLRRS